MLDIVINNQKFKYVNCAKIDDKSYIAYTDGVSVFISAFHYENGKMILEEVDKNTFNSVKEVIS